MEENKPNNSAANQIPTSEVYNLGTGEKKPSILGKLLGGVMPSLSGVEKPKIEVLPVAAPTGGNALGAAIGAQIQLEKKQAAMPTRSIADLLGPRPDIDPAALEEKRRRSEHRARSFFYAAVSFAVLVFGFFQSQLNPDVTILVDQFGPNKAVQFEQSNAEVKKIQTDGNMLQHRIARLWLDVVNTKIDALTQYVTAAKTATNLTEQAKAEAQAAKLSAEIKEALTAVQSIFAQDLGIDTYTPMPVSFQEREAEFTQLLKDALVSQKETLRGSAPQANDQNRNDLRAIESVQRLVENKRVRALIKNAQLKTMSNDDLVKLLADVRSEGIDEFAQIEKLKQVRIDWEALINNIHAVVRSADPHYGHGLFKTVGGFMFSSYRFDDKTGRVSISGVTRTADSKTFTFIATLIDAIEKSPYFKEIDFRSFSKTRDESGDFSAGINLEFAIEKPDESNQ